MKKISVMLVFLLAVTVSFSQEICVGEEEKVVDVNTINKCAVEVKEQKLEKEYKNVETSRRYLKKRVVLASKAYTISDLKTKNIAVVKTDDAFIKKELLAVKSKVKEVSNSIATNSISFNSVEEIPQFVSCKESTIDKVVCFNYEMEKHLTTHFTYPQEALDKEIEGDLQVSFIIDVEGKVTNIKVTGAKNKKMLKKEAVRIVSLLPNFVAAKEQGKPISVFYSFPMSFTLE